eukprot:scaffold119603_cov36-Phaeocystis_antarctica.AAC.1
MEVADAGSRTPGSGETEADDGLAWPARALFVDRSVGQEPLITCSSSSRASNPTLSASFLFTLSRYVARLKPRCGSLALSVMWYVLKVRCRRSQVGAMARFD